ncbi:MAG: NADH:ubiquinone reductase (Na(+)-transporting) subunit A, partial [Thermoguttaceae bacterium]|nr:NADH:ubiquinone reductase (Na(+)-transporting) subunit A [Thermoguttaceae bacterium]
MKYVKITKGLDLRMTGTPDQTSAPEKKSVKRVAVTGPDYVGMKPTILVEVGEKVLLGQPLFEDQKNPGVKFVAPATGVVASINRGAKRAFRSIIIDVAEGEAAK